MDLKAICLQNMFDQIKQLPPLLLEEVIGHSLKTIKEQAKQEAKNELLAELKRDSELVIDDLTDAIASSRRNGGNWVRPEYTKDIDDDIYHNFVHISEMILNKYSQEIIFNNPRTLYDAGYSDFEEESDY